MVATCVCACIQSYYVLFQERLPPVHQTKSIHPINMDLLTEARLLQPKSDEQIIKEKKMRDKDPIDKIVAV